MKAVADCNIFIYVLSNESVQSKYCQAEFAEARRLQKRVITIQARDRTNLTGKLRDIQYVDMKYGVDDPDALVSLSGALDRQMRLVRNRRPRWKPRTPKPSDDDVPERPTDAPEVDTPDLVIPQAQNTISSTPAERPWWRNSTFIIGAVIVPILAAILAAVIQNPNFLNFLATAPTPTPPARTDCVDTCHSQRRLDAL